MSKCTPRSEEFINEIKRAINEACRYSYSVKDVKVYYDASKWSKKDYVADISLYKNSTWCSEDTKWLKEAMRTAGATGVIGGIKHAIARDYLDLAFDIKKSKMKELGIDISN